MAIQNGDVVDVLMDDHRQVEEWFQEYDRATTVDDKQRLANNIVIELVRHGEVEEQFVYPRMRQVIPDGDRMIDMAVSQHSHSEEIMNRLDGKNPGDGDFDALVHELAGVIREHIGEEERISFPQFRKSLSSDEAKKLADTVRKAKKVAPTRPHPAAPDQPPFNVLLGPGAAVVDRARDFLSGRKVQ
jgi:hemerythrin superfamily protein